jgi:glycosyltransferase involved in cell wall biosynthesis
MRASADVSIVLPTFNRADVIGRAIASVRAQTFEDWELLIVDDGSTDGTAALVAELDDERIRLIPQANAGVYVARNNGLRHAQGRFITFLDSDDAWLPHFLALTIAFLRHAPDQHFVTTEFLEDLGNGVPILHDAHEIGAQYPAMARAIGSRLLDLPAGETDDYRRVYASAEPLGDWGRTIAERAGAPGAKLYRGSIFEPMRFGYLNWLPITVLTRHALDTVGPFTTHTRSAADYRFLCRLARSFPANMISVPSATKYDRAPGTKLLNQAHLAKGAAAYRFELNKLGFFDELFWQTHGGDPEIELLRCHYLLNAGRAALRLGRRADAITHLRAAARWKPGLWGAYVAWAGCRALPSDRWVGAGYRLGHRVRELGARIKGRGGPY